MSAAVPGRHSESALRDFLTRLTRTLEARRPWPEPRVRRLDATDWRRFTERIARLTDTRIGASRRLGNRFEEVDLGDGRRAYLLLLRLATGEEVALTAPDGQTAVGVVLRQPPGQDAAMALRHFCEFTGFPPDRVEPLP